MQTAQQGGESIPSSSLSSVSHERFRPLRFYTSTDSIKHLFLSICCLPMYLFLTLWRPDCLPIEFHSLSSSFTYYTVNIILYFDLNITDTIMLIEEISLPLSTLLISQTRSLLHNFPHSHPNLLPLLVIYSTPSHIRIQNFYHC